MSAFDFLDIADLSVAGVVYLSLALTVAFTILSVLIAYAWRRWRG